jgi:hypothetical protein
LQAVPTRRTNRRPFEDVAVTENQHHDHRLVLEVRPELTDAPGLGCSDDSPNQHAIAQYEKADHPVVGRLPRGSRRGGGTSIGARSEPGRRGAHVPDSRSRRRDASISASAATRPTHAVPSTLLPGSSSL